MHKKTLRALLLLYAIASLVYGGIIYKNTAKQTLAQEGEQCMVCDGGSWRKSGGSCTNAPTCDPDDESTFGGCFGATEGDSCGETPPCFVCDDGYWRDSGNNCARSAPQCRAEDASTFNGCFNAKVDEICDYPPADTKLNPATVPNSSDINPNSKLQYCKPIHADTGVPIESCAIGRSEFNEKFEGHSYMRYAGRDFNGRLYCQRSLCISDSTLQPFEYECSDQDADRPDPSDTSSARSDQTIGTSKQCQTADGKVGASFVRYSFTAPNSQLYCYDSPCESVDEYLKKQGQNTTTKGNPLTNIQSEDERTWNNATIALVPSEIRDSQQDRAEALPQNLFQSLIEQFKRLFVRVGTTTYQTQDLSNSYSPFKDTTVDTIPETLNTSSENFMSSEIPTLTNVPPVGGFMFGNTSMDEAAQAKQQIWLFCKANYPDGTCPALNQ